MTSSVRMSEMSGGAAATPAKTATTGQGKRVQDRSVWDVLRSRQRTGSKPLDRSDDFKVALAIEGGGMRAAISGGMVLALHRSGLLPCIDTVYGSSAGTINGAWLLSSDPEGIIGWIDPQWARQLIGLRNLVAGKPFVNVSGLIDHLYVHEYPLDYASVLASPVPLHPLATSATTGQAVDLGARLTTAEQLRTAIRASCALPIAAGGPVVFGADSYTDAGLSESIPIRTAAAGGATHVLVFRTHPAAYRRPPEGMSRVSRHALAGALRMTGHGPSVATAVFTRADRSAVEETHLAAGEMPGPNGRVQLATVWPDADVIPPSRTERNGARLQAAFEAGIAAFNRAAS